MWCFFENYEFSSVQQQRTKKLKSHKSRQRASQPLAPNLKYDYPIVRHHPLFAKQSKLPGQSNFSSLLMGNNVRIIRGQSLSSNESMDDRFEIFNPEIDDSDSDNDNDRYYYLTWFHITWKKDSRPLTWFY